MEVDMNDLAIHTFFGNKSTTLRFWISGPALPKYLSLCQDCLLAHSSNVGLWARAHLEAPRVMGSDPITQAIDISCNLFVKDRISERRHFLQCGQDILHQTIVQIWDPLHSARKVTFMFVHHDWNQVMDLIATRLPVEIGSAIIEGKK